MLADNADFVSRRMCAVSAASVRGDEPVFDAVLARLVASRQPPGIDSNPDVIAGLWRVKGELHTALERFRIDWRRATLHRTVDLIEQSGPLADRTARAAAQQLILVRLSGGVEQERAAQPPRLAQGLGPAVTGVSRRAHVDGQRGVDAVLSDFGM